MLSICIFILFVNLKEKYYDDIYTTSFVENISSPQQVIWKSENEVIFATNEKFYIYSFQTNSSDDIREKDGNEIVGVKENGDLIYCKYDIFMRYTEKDYAMKVGIYDNNHNFVKSIDLYNSFLPLYINEKYIEGITTMPFLVPYTYRVDIDSSQVQETEGIEDLEKRYSRPNGLNLPNDIDVAKAYCLNNEKCIIENSVGNIFAYEKKVSHIKTSLQELFQKSREFFLQYFPK